MLGGDCERGCWLAGLGVGLLMWLVTPGLWGGLVIGLISGGLLAGLLVWGLCRGRGGTAEDVVVLEPRAAEPLAEDVALRQAGAAISSGAAILADQAQRLVEAARRRARSSDGPDVPGGAKDASAAARPGPETGEARETRPSPEAAGTTGQSADLAAAQPESLRRAGQAAPLVASPPERASSSAGGPQKVELTDTVDPSGIAVGDPRNDDLALAPDPGQQAEELTPIAEIPRYIDDVCEINGVTEKDRKLLEQHGVTRLEQVAGWGDAEIERYAALLEVSPERVRAEDWPGQARMLRDEGGRT